jgi:hypothetical protein
LFILVLVVGGLWLIEQVWPFLIAAAGIGLVVFLVEDDAVAANRQHGRCVGRRRWFDLGHAVPPDDRRRLCVAVRRLDSELALAKFGTAEISVPGFSRIRGTVVSGHPAARREPGNHRQPVAFAYQMLLTFTPRHVFASTMICDEWMKVLGTTSGRRT